MTPEIAADPLPLPGKQRPSTAGMTTKVVKGSIWTLAGQVVPLLATLITTPFVIRLLGSESYGVLLLVGLIPNYFTFADFGMGMASTKFGSEAYGRGDREGEAAVVRTAALIALICSSAVALPIIVFAASIVAALNVPAHLLPDATLALRLTAGSFVAANLSNVFNTPQLTRLRMDLNAVINATGRVVLAVGTVTVLFLGGGIVGAAAFGLAIAILVLSLHLVVSQKFVADLIGLSFKRDMLPVLFKFGSGLLISGIATILLINLEKLLLTKLVSVQALAYYSVAFTFANIAVMFSWAMVQSLIPAFSQLLGSGEREQFEKLFSRSVRLLILWLMPTLMFLTVLGRPFLSIWAGEEFGRESTGPFYVLLVGLLFNVVALAPYSALVASGHTGAIAKVSWLELLPYAIIVVFLVSRFGILGAAAAWSIRVAADAIVFLWLSRRYVGTRITSVREISSPIVGSIALLPPIVISMFGGLTVIANVAIACVCLVIYALLVWKMAITDDEKSWLSLKFSSCIDYLRIYRPTKHVAR